MAPYRFLSSSLFALPLLAALNLTAVADAPSGHFVTSAERVEDEATRLTWQRLPSPQRFDHREAQEHCENLRLSGGNFRLPTLKELHTLVDETRMDPAIDPKVFPNTESAHFWTSSHLITFPQYVWTVNFEDGTDLWLAADKPLFVRCVRDAD